MPTIDVAESTSFAFLCVVQATCPVYSNIALLAIESCGSFHGTASADPAELKETVKDGTVITDIVLPLLAHEIVHVVRCDLLEEVDVLVGVELGHLGENARLCTL